MTTRLFALWPGTMPACPPSSPVAPARVSSRRFACREFSSGPWQARQFLAKIGRMSRLKLTLTSAGSASATPGSRATARTEIAVEIRGRRIISKPMPESSPCRRNTSPAVPPCPNQRIGGCPQCRPASIYSVYCCTPRTPWNAPWAGMKSGQPLSLCALPLLFPS